MGIIVIIGDKNHIVGLLSPIIYNILVIIRDYTKLYPALDVEAILSSSGALWGFWGSSVRHLGNGRERRSSLWTRSGACRLCIAAALPLPDLSLFSTCPQRRDPTSFLEKALKDCTILSPGPFWFFPGLKIEHPPDNSATLPRLFGLRPPPFWLLFWGVSAARCFAWTATAYIPTLERSL